MRRNFSILLLAFVIGCAAFPAFAQEDGEKIIQGRWNLTGTLPQHKGDRPFTWFLEWKFSDGNFLLIGYPPLSQKGKYRILKNDGDKLTLDLYEQSGNFGTKNKPIEIIIDRKTDMLKIDGKEWFKRVKDKTND